MFFFRDLLTRKQVHWTFKGHILKPVRSMNIALSRSHLCAVQLSLVERVLGKHRVSIINISSALNWWQSEAILCVRVCY